jgi:hypothetical protein
MPDVPCATQRGLRDPKTRRWRWDRAARFAPPCDVSRVPHIRSCSAILGTGRRRSGLSLACLWRVEYPAHTGISCLFSEPLTWAEICEEYPDQWVCLVEPGRAWSSLVEPGRAWSSLVEIDHIHPRGFDFRTARVVGHGKTRREPLDQAAACADTYNVIGHYFTGRIAAARAPLLRAGVVATYIRRPPSAVTARPAGWRDEIGGLVGAQGPALNQRHAGFQSAGRRDLRCRRGVSTSGRSGARERRGTPCRAVGNP